MRARIPFPTLIAVFLDRCVRSTYAVLWCTIHCSFAAALSGALGTIVVLVCPGNDSNCNSYSPADSRMFMQQKLAELS